MTQFDDARPPDTGHGRERLLELTAIVKPDLVDPIRDALLQADIVGMTITEVKGYGRQRGHRELYLGSEYVTTFFPKVHIMVLLPESRAQTAVNILVDIVQQKLRAREQEKDARAKASKRASDYISPESLIGEGIVYIKEVLEAVRLRTNEHLVTGQQRRR